MWSRIPKSVIERLGRVPLFSGCSQDELRSIARLGTPLEVDVGKVLTEQGSSGREFFLVLEGKAECTTGRKSLALFGPGDYFGELALLEGGSRTATVTATTPMRVLVLSITEFSDLLRTSPSVSVKLLANLAGRLRRAQSSLHD
jgi:CRP-like cAMP-binding protein